MWDKEELYRQPYTLKISVKFYREASSFIHICFKADVHRRLPGGTAFIQLLFYRKMSLFHTNSPNKNDLNMKKAQIKVW